MPEINTDITKVAKDVTSLAKDATYVAIGLGVITYQKAQVQRQELVKRLNDSGFEPSLVGMRAEVAKQITVVDGKVEDVLSRVETAVAPFEDRLPGQARDLARQLHAQAYEVRQQIRSAIQTAAA